MSCALAVYAPHQPETAIYRILPAARNNESRLLIDTIIAVAENCFPLIGNAHWQLLLWKFIGNSSLPSEQKQNGSDKTVMAMIRVNEKPFFHYQLMARLRTHNSKMMRMISLMEDNCTKFWPDQLARSFRLRFIRAESTD